MNISYSDAIRAIRRSRGISQQSFATECGISIRGLAFYEAGERVPNIEKTVAIYRIAKEHGLHKEAKLLRDLCIDRIRKMFESLEGIIDDARMP